MKFERGRDPKESMDVGVMSSEEMQSTIEKYTELIDYIERFRNSGVPLIKRAIDVMVKSRPPRLVTQYGWSNMHDMFEKLTKEEYTEIHPIINKWHNKLGYEIRKRSRTKGNAPAGLT